MKFIEQKRVEYKTNTLFEVVFQARFPKIIRISSEAPAEFQELIRKAGFPETNVNTSNLPSDLPIEIRNALKVEKTYNFLSEEGNWQITLADDFISLACLNSYENYSDFKKRLKIVLNIFCKIYEPSYYNRLGLRYRNLMNKSVLPIDDDFDIKEFIPQYIAPEFHEDIKSDINSFDKKTQFYDGNSFANVEYLYAKVSGVFGRQQINNDLSYIVDIDCFSQDKVYKVENAITSCDKFNKNVRNIFRWSITEKLHKIMDPKQKQ